MAFRREFACQCFAGSAVGAAHACAPTATRRRVLEGFAGVIALAAFGIPARSQVRWTLSLKGACSFYPRKLNAADNTTNASDAVIETYDPVEDGARIVGRVAESVGLQPNFEVLQASNVANAAAVIYEHTRYVLYNKDFIKQIVAAADTEWASWTIMAHEVGHHLNGHTLTDVGSRPPLELEADHFAGFSVHRMGGTLPQALSAYEQLSVEGSSTHPPRADREVAVKSGWEQAALIARGIEEGPVTRPEAANLLKRILQKLQAGYMPDVTMSPVMQRTMKQEAGAAVTALQQRGYILGIQLASQQQLPNKTFLYRFQVQLVKGPMVWRLWLDQAGTLVGLQYT